MRNIRKTGSGSGPSSIGPKPEDTGKTAKAGKKGSMGTSSVEHLSDTGPSSAKSMLESAGPSKVPKSLTARATAPIEKASPIQAEVEIPRPGKTLLDRAADVYLGVEAGIDTGVGFVKSELKRIPQDVGVTLDFGARMAGKATKGVLGYVLPKMAGCIGGIFYGKERKEVFEGIAKTTFELTAEEIGQKYDSTSTLVGRTVKDVTDFAVESAMARLMSKPSRIAGSLVAALVTEELNKSFPDLDSNYVETIAWMTSSYVLKIPDMNMELLKKIPEGTLMGPTGLPMLQIGGKIAEKLGVDAQVVKYSIVYLCEKLGI